MALEERWLLPAFDAWAERAAPNQRPTVVRADHERLRSWLDVIERPVIDLASQVARAEALATLLQVLDHHDRREADGMLSVLEDHPDRDAWLARIEAEEPALPPALAPRPAPPPWGPEPDDPADALAAAAAQDAPLGELPALPGRNGERVGGAVFTAVGHAVGAASLVERRDTLLDVLDALRRWRAVRDAMTRVRRRSPAGGGRPA
jgi:Hemerythrin HHE cation binding domain